MLFSLGVRNRGAAVIARIGRHFRLFKHVGGDLCGLDPFARALEHGLKQMRLLPFPMGFGVHDDLMFLIDHRHPVVALVTPWPVDILALSGSVMLLLRSLPLGPMFLELDFRKLLIFSILHLYVASFLLSCSAMGLSFSLASRPR